MHRRVEHDAERAERLVALLRPEPQQYDVALVQLDIERGVRQAISGASSTCPPVRFRVEEEALLNCGISLNR